MIDGIITSVGDKIKAMLQATIGQWLSLDWIPAILFWYWWLFLLFLFCGVVIWFFGWSKIVRIVASMTFLFAAIFVAGGHVMYRIMKGKNEAEREKLKREQAAAKTKASTPRRDDGGFFGKWGS